MVELAIFIIGFVAGGAAMLWMLSWVYPGCSGDAMDKDHRQ